MLDLLLPMVPFAVWVSRMRESKNVSRPFTESTLMKPTNGYVWLFCMTVQFINVLRSFTPIVPKRNWKEKVRAINSWLLAAC